MSIIEIDGVKCLDLTSLKSIPDELSESPIWEIKEFKLQEYGSYYKIKGRSHGYYRRKGGCRGHAIYYCELTISECGDPKITSFDKKIVE